MSDSENEKVRCLIIGSGPAGYTAAIYASRMQIYLRCFMKEYSRGTINDNYGGGEFPGYPDGITGPELMEDLKTSRPFWCGYPFRYRYRR